MLRSLLFMRFAGSIMKHKEGYEDPRVMRSRLGIHASPGEAATWIVLGANPLFLLKCVLNTAAYCCEI